MPWSDVVTPAADLAQNFSVGALLAQYIRDYPTMIALPGLKEVYAPNGKGLLVPLFSTVLFVNFHQEGELCSNPKLAHTLRTIAASGVDIFYNGEMGEKLVQDVSAAGGILTFEDLQNYEVNSLL